MRAGQKHPVPAKDRILQKRLRRLGAAILVAGLVAAIVIDRRATSAGEAEYLVESGTLLSGNAKRYENQMKQIGGVSNVVAAEFSEWFTSLWHGKRLARTVGVLAIAGALGCFLAAHLLNYPPPEEKSRNDGTGESRPRMDAE